MADAKSPLVQVNTASAKHEPKVVTLYNQLFTQETHPPGYWIELFLLPVAESELAQIIRERPSELYVTQPIILRTLIAGAVENLSNKDEFIRTNSLQVLKVVLQIILEARLPSSDLIRAIAGIDKIDGLFDKLTDSLVLFLADKSQPALNFLLVVASSAYGTCLTPYFSRTNFFTPLISIIGSNPASDVRGLKAFVLIGVLANLNKFSDNVDPYLQRITDFVDQDVMEEMLALSEIYLQSTTSDYIQATISKPGWLDWFSSSSTTPKDLSKLPGSSVAVVFPIYEIASHNEYFAAKLCESRQFGQFVELASHVVQNQQKSRSVAYARFILLTMRHFVECSAIFERLCEQDNKMIFDISQQRAPALERDLNPRSRIAGILDVLQCCLRFNVRKNMDAALYNMALTTLLQIFVGIRRTRQYVAYNWSQLWNTFMLVLRHFSKTEAQIPSEIAGSAVLVVASCLLEGGIVDPQEYNDLFYRVMDNSELFHNLSKRYALSKTLGMVVVQGMIAHYQLLNAESTGFSESKISDVVKQGYHSMSLFDKSKKSLLSGIDRFSETSEQQFLKTTVRIVFGDAIKYGYS